MGQIIRPGVSPSFNDPNPRRRPFFLVSLVQEFGAQALAVLVAAAVFALAPLALLTWLNLASLSPVVTFAALRLGRRSANPAVVQR